jgi:hypothetical protein
MAILTVATVLLGGGISLLAASYPAVVKTQGLIDAARVRQVLERRLRVPLTERPPLDVSPGMANVEATYEGQAGGHVLLVVVFDSKDATVQVARGAGESFGGSGQVLRRDNVVVLYTHRRGTADRGREVAAALAASPAS